VKKVLAWGLVGVVLLGAGAMLPFQSRDIAQLVPIEALVVSVSQDKVVLNGGECSGRGSTWEDAWKDLKNSGDGWVFFGTAEQIVLVGGAVKLLTEVVSCEELRPAANVCVALGTMPQPEKVSAYLSAHNSGVTLQKVRADLKQGACPILPVLITEEGEMRLYETENR